MSLQVQEIGPTQLADYASIPSRFWVKSIFKIELIQDGLDGILLLETTVTQPYQKDYDAYGELPTDWPRKYDVSKWGFWLATVDRKPVGGASVAFGFMDGSMMEDRLDLSVLWDLRVKQEARGTGILLFRKAAAWSQAHGCKQMKIETQNVNVPACRFYQGMGAKLGEIRRFGYAAVPAVAHEIMLCWYLDL
jgi:GNAT superfamily N-acetyltransferase